MPISSAEALLAELEPLPVGVRFGTAIRHALALSPAGHDPLIRELGEHGAYGRELAAAVAAATGAGVHIVAALDDPSPRVRARALRAALSRPGLVDPAVLVRVVTEGPRDFRLALYRGLRPRGGTAVRADELIGPVRKSWGDREGARLLPACDGATVRGLLPELAYAVSNWSAIGHRHPDAVREYVAAELAAATGAARPGWWAQNWGPVAALTRYAPGDLLGLCERWLTGVLPGAVLAHFGVLLAHDTGRTVRLLLADPARVRQVGSLRLSRRDVTRLLTRPDAELGDLLRIVGGGVRHVPHWERRGGARRSSRVGQFQGQVIGRAAPSRREALFDAANAGRDLTAEQVPEVLLAALPHARRHAEVRRMLALPAVRDSPTLVVQLGAYLPYPEAVAALVPITRSADAEERGDAYAALIRAAAGSRDRAAVTDLFSHLGRVRNEQDPVRMSVLWHLAEVHPDLFDPVDPAVRDALDRLVRDAMDARDRSHTTLTSVQKLIFNVLTATAAAEPTAPTTTASPLLAWALDAVERLTLWTYAATADSGWQTLRRGREHEVFARIRPWLVAAVERGQPAAVLGVARALGRRARAVGDLQALLRAATRATDDATIQPAVDLWLEPPTTRAARAAELVAYDESYVTLPPVLRTLAYRRPDLVDSLILAGRPLRGRFGTDDARWIPEVDARTVAGWTPARIGRYAVLLRGGVDDADLQVWSRAAFARSLASLAGPSAVADLIAPPADPVDPADPGAAPGAAPEVPIVEGALAGLGAYGAPLEALPVLLDRADGDRARVAVFAAGRCVRRIRPRDLTAVLTAALDARKVTVRKEAARLLAVARPPGAVDALLAAWRSPDLHRDVRIAVATALREWPEDPRVWTVFDEVHERDLALSLASVAPQSVPVAYRPRFAAVVRRLAHHPDRLVVRSAHEALRHWLPVDPGCADDLAEAVTDLTPGREWRHALRSLAEPAVWGSVPGLLTRVATELVRMSTVDVDAEPTRDRPARQRLRHLVDELRITGVLRRHPSEVRQTVDVLRADPTFTLDAARLAAGLLWPGPTLADDLLRMADLLAGLPATVGGIIREIPFSQWPGLDAASLDRAASGLAGRSDAPAGLLAVALVAAVGDHSGWPQRWREYLRGLRRHPEADVRLAALGPVTYRE